jgi:GTP pyrophosphokinase
MIRQFELVEKVRAYDPNVDEAMLNRAYVFSMKAHGAQMRASGDPYFSHPLEVAGILTEYKLDGETITTALLHDTVEDTVATAEQIEDMFGERVGKLVDGVTKLSKLELRSEANQQAENFRKLLLAMSDDIRVLLVKLADRLHNMRTIHYLKKPEKRRRIAAETMEIYAPLAGRLGMHDVKEELEDIAFRELNPDAHKSMLRRMEYLSADDETLIEQVIVELRETMAKFEIEARITGRRKKPYSIWRKMERDNIAFEQLMDIVGFRVIVQDVPSCYQALGVVHGRYRVVPGRFKDYISTPKRNGYQSIHTAVIGPAKHRIEIQIRSEEMDQVAEKGVAAHWSYKQGVGSADGRRYRWLQGLIEILENTNSPEEFLEHSKLEMFTDQVFCFTPKGDVIGLPRGGSPVDFAYAVHTDVGNTMVGAKVNQKVVPLRTVLRNGDQVEVLRSKTATPSASWENFVITGKARAAIRTFIRNQQRAEYERLGRAVAEKAFRDADHNFSEESLDHAIKALNLRSAEELYQELGRGELTGGRLLKIVFPGDRRWGPRDAIGAINRLLPGRLRRGGDDKSSVPVTGLKPGVAVHYGECCHPLPGDRIVGIMRKGRGVILHTIDCPNLEAYSDESERWVDVKWDVDPDHQSFYVGRVKAIVPNEPGSLSEVATMIASNLGNISNLNFTERSQDFFEMQIDIEVTDVKHLTNIIAALRATPIISKVERVMG